MIALAQALMETRDTGDFLRAEELLKGALQRESYNANGWRLLADVYAHQGKEALAKYATAERFYARGDINSARDFAQRAQEDLPRNLPQWRRASDIVVVVESQLATKNGRRQGGRKPIASLSNR